MADEQLNNTADTTGKPLEEQSPSEKLEDKAPGASSIPGAENPESTEIKHETNFNTE
jgi:hypothetical protein